MERRTSGCLLISGLLGIAPLFSGAAEAKPKAPVSPPRESAEEDPDEEEVDSLPVSPGGRPATAPPPVHKPAPAAATTDDAGARPQPVASPAASEAPDRPAQEDADDQGTEQAGAQDAAKAEGEGEDAGADEEEGLGLTVEAALSSAYVFRGINVFQAEKQMDQHAMASFSAGYSIGPFAVLYWSAYQLNGDNRAANVDGGIGAEQDIYLTWEQELTDGLSVTGGLAAYLYPFSRSEVTGTDLPMYLEPSLAAAWSGPVDLGLALSFFYGVGETLETERYIYVNPTVGRSFELHDRVGLEVSAGFGYKLFTQDREVADNNLDLLLNVAAPITALDFLTLQPSIHFAWTDLKSFDEETFKTSSLPFGDEYVLWGALTVTFEK